MAAWTIADIPSQAGRTAAITGISKGGLGYESALALAGAGAGLILLGRNPAKGREAVEGVRAAHPNANVSFEPLDLADLASVAAAGAKLAALPKLDLLINNAGVMALPTRQTTADGFEMQFGVNHLGHFALTAHALPTLKRTPGARVVNVSSLAHRNGRMRFDDLQFTRGYHPWAAYCQSKLANLLFTFEFERRSAASGWNVSANAAHPGYARTELIPNGPGQAPLLGRLLQPGLSHSAAAGALPTLFAAVATSAKGGCYYGPNGFYELKGPPAPAKVMPQARDEAAARRLWEASEQLTGVRFA